jgi:two-component system, OmpR family, sensor kinase
MFRTLYARLATALVLLFMVIGVLFTLIITKVTERHMQEVNQHFNRNLAQRIVSDRSLVAEGRIDQKALKKTFSAYMDINPSIEIYLLDPEGRILAFSADPGKVKRQSVDLKPIGDFLDGEMFLLLGDDPRSHDRRKAFSVTRVPTGYLYVVLRGEQYDTAQQAVEESYALRLGGWALAGSLGFGLLAGLLLFHLLTRRLQRLSDVMRSFEQSEFTRHHNYTREQARIKDEVDRLGITFDEMAERIIDQWGELKKQDQLRRELVAQVSHDLRTPLAALHGYLETLDMKAGDLNQGESQEYIDIALRQSGRLRQMVEELFELASLEARDQEPQCEPAAIAELMHDVMQKSSLRAEQAGIKLRMDPPASFPMVMADIAMTERVLDNLIGNAIDHTPQGGEVVLGLEQLDDSVVITLTDSGPGIPDQDLANIFKPFYRGVDASRDGNHAGLGLAIANRMVKLQSGSIEVSNAMEGGAVFSFSLPLAMQAEIFP